MGITPGCFGAHTLQRKPFAGCKKGFLNMAVKILRKPLVGIVLVLLSIFLFSACQSKADSSRAPDFTLLNLNGDRISLADFRGKVVLINFFATYCPPCRMEIPDFVRLASRYGRDGFAIIGISVDQNPRKVLPYFIQALKINYPVLLATQKVLRDYGNIYALPATFLLNRDHKIVKSYTGMITEAEIEPIIRRLVAEKAH